ncbi:GyrI-like domain-containing protein [Micromonospora sp. NPDC003197]
MKHALAAQMAADAVRLSTVEARLRMIEEEGHMDTEEVVLKKLSPIRVAELTAIAASYGPEHIGPAIGPLYPELYRRTEAAGVTPTGPSFAYYEAAPDEAGDDAVVVHAALPVTVGPRPGYDFAVVDLPAVDLAASIIHHGPMTDVQRSDQILARWIDANGYRPVGLHREIYLDYHPDAAEKGVTELQIAVVRS